jgi:3-keto-5-aminohexanoate cleavage enzyme
LSLPPELAAPCLLMVAPNGARRQPSDHPALPIIPDQVAVDAEACHMAGAAAIHLHAREPDGSHTLDPAICRAFLDAVTARLGRRLAVQLTTEAVGRYRPAEQMALVEALRPPSVSIAMRELVPVPGDEGEAAAFLGRLREQQISPQFILYTPAEVRLFQGLRQRGVVPQAQPFVIFVLGRYLAPGQVSRPADLLEFLEAHDPACPWMVCAFGRTETAALALAAALGGHLRVGFENNLEHANGRLAGCNAERVAAIAEIVRAIGRPLADGAAARELLEAAAA